jgi:hypothetical protein
MSFREVSEDDILKEWIYCREENLLGYLTDEDKQHEIGIDKISEKILRNVPKKNQKFVRKQLDRLDRNFINHISYWNEKYYRNGFVDGVRIVAGCLEE